MGSTLVNPKKVPIKINNKTYSARPAKKPTT